MQGRGYTDRGTVDLGVGLRPVAAQEKPAEIWHGRAKECRQFRVRARGLPERLRERPDKVTNRDIYGAIFSGCGHDTRSIKTESEFVEDIPRINPSSRLVNKCNCS